ncbi:MMPL family transporter [bacterium]|nr:MMPL family transporter [bacterium]
MIKKLASFIVNKRWLLLLFIFILTLGLAYQMKNLYYENRLIQWLPQGDPVLKMLLETGEKFGTNELVMVVIKAREGKTFSPEILRRVQSLTEELKAHKEIFWVTSISNIPRISQIPGGIEVRNFLQDIPQSPQKIQALKDYALSEEDYVNQVISPDGEWLSAAIYIKPDGDTIEIFREVVKPAVEKNLSPAAQFYFSGVPSDAYFADEFISSDLKKLVPIIILLILVVLYLSFRNFKGVFFPSSVVVIASVWVFGLMGWMGWPMTLITPALPVLLVALGSAYGIHVVNKLFHEIEYSQDRNTNLKSSLSGVTVPVVMAGVTTVVGFLSFASARLSLIRDFGLQAAAGIFFAMIISLIFIPAGFAVSRKKGSEAKKKRKGFSVSLGFLSRFIRKQRNGVLISAFVLMGIFCIGIFSIHREVNFSEYYPRNSQPRKALRIVKENFGGAYPLTIDFKTENIKSASVLRVMRRAQNYIYNLPKVSRPLSVTDYIQEMNHKLNGRYHIPETDRGVSNLWFFMEGRDELKQLITEDYTETLVLAKVPTSATSFMKKMKSQVKKFLEEEFSQGLFEYTLEEFSQEKRKRLRKKEARYLVDEMAWLSRHYGGDHFDKSRAKKKLFELIENPPRPQDEDVMMLVEKEFRKYIFSEYFDFLLSRNIKEKLFIELLESLASGEGAPSDFEKILSQRVPSSEYDPQIASDVALTLRLRIEESLHFAFAQRACGSLDELFPLKAKESENFCKRRFGLFYEIADSKIVLPGPLTQNLQGEKIPFERIKQSGQPAALAKLDHFLYTSQIQSLGIALIVTFLLMSMLRRSFSTGVISVIPILFTIAVIYGFLGFFGIRLDFATMMTASVSIGVGIDYVIHFIHGVSSGLDRGVSLNESVHQSYMEKGKAILTNSIAVMAGFLVLLFSSMSPLRHFGGIMAGSMFLAALSTLTILPGLILLFKPKLTRTIHKKGRDI